MGEGIEGLGLDDTVEGLGLEESGKEEPTGVPEETPAPEGAPAPETDTPKEVQEQKGAVPDKYVFDDHSEEFNKAVGETARELGLTQEQAQRYEEASTTASGDELIRMARDWADKARKDPDIGGDKFDSTIATARRVFDKYLTDPELRRILAYSGITNHPAFLRAFRDIGKSLGIDGPGRRSMFPNSRMGD